MTGTAEVPGATNFRDIGGLPAGVGMTRSGVLWRSGDLSRLDEAGAAALRALGVRHVVDLRTTAEIRRAPSVGLGAEVRTTHIPLFTGSAESYFLADATLAEMYRSIVDDSAPAIVDAVRAVLSSSPVLVHCTLGKDRTGVTVALTLAAVGVDHDAVVADYALTEASLPVGHGEGTARWLARAYPGAVNVQALATRSPAVEMQALLAYVADRHGSAAGYLRAAGLAEDEVSELRRLLVIDHDDR